MLTISFLGHSQKNEKASLASATEKRIDLLLNKMTLEEKIGQMTQVTIDVVSVTNSTGVVEPHQVDLAKLHNAIVDYHVGSILNVANHCYTREHWLEIISAIDKMTTGQTVLKIPVLYGIDAIHGATYTEKSTLFPQEIAMAATWNPQLVEQAGSITAYETRASYIPWNFSPVLDMGRNPVWPRLWETFGEDVFLTSTMGKALVNGYEGGDISDKYKVASCLKHYMGYSFPLSGKDRTPAWIPENYLREYFLTPFAEAVKAGAHSIMINSGEINGTPVHADHHILTDILRGELGFKGIAVSDWEDIKRLYTIQHVASSPKEAVKMAVLAGVDMSMVPMDFTFYDYLLQLVKEGSVPQARIDEAVRRILRVKMELGLFENMYYPASDYPKFGSEEFRLANLETAREAVTLLKNDNKILPLPKNAKVLVTGFAANSMRCLNGGWTYTWQGQLSDTYAEYKSTILEAIQAKIGGKNVLYAEGTRFDSLSDINNALQLAGQADYIVLCLGELSYTEQMGNIDDLYLPDAQVEFAKKLAATGKPVILVLTEGRPRIISKFADAMKGILQAYLPGNEGGPAIADILFGDVNPSGKLSYTYPRYPNDLTHYDHKYNEDSQNPLTSNTSFYPQFPFGFGLSYTEFKYSNLTISKKILGMDESLNITVDVTNTGALKGKEVVQLYVSDLYASNTPSVKRLRGFEKIELLPGQTKTVSFDISSRDLAFVNRELKWITEPGEFRAEIGGLKQEFEFK
ncbi:MAG: glycoside hydrolase family 3 N-terminal domain-containing protein [Bacteroidota bacterium]